MGIRQNIRDLIPPVLLRACRSFAQPADFLWPFPSWEAARKVSTGYDAEAILRKTREAARKVRDGAAAYERDSVLFDKVEYSWPLLAALLWVASRESNRLHVVDFGGSLGTTYFQNRRFLDHLQELTWSIVEQPHYVAAGRAEFEAPPLRFFDTLRASVQCTRPQVILFSGVLMYLERPYAVLDEVKQTGFDYVIFDRTVFVAGDTDLLAVQKVPPAVFDASYPCWFFSLARLTQYLSTDYELVADFEGFEHASVPLSSSGGFILRRKNR